MTKPGNLAQKKSMDAREATRLVKEYFEEANGPFGTVLFQVESVEPSLNQAGAWDVRCSYIPGIHATQRSFFHVVVHADGSFGRVEKVGSFAP